MESKVNYTLVGLFVVILIAALISIIVWFTARSADEDVTLYMTQMREEVSGLNVQSPVRFNGVKVGYVKAIYLDQKNPQKVQIILAVLNGTPITTSTVAVLQSEGITGVSYIGLKALTPGAELLVAHAGEKYPIIPSEPSLLVKLGDAIQRITSSIQKLTEDVNEVFDDKNRLAIADTLQHIQIVTEALSKNAHNINSSLASANTLLKNGAKASEQFPDVVHQMERTLKALEQASTQIGQTGQSITHTMSDARNSVQTISTQIMPSTQQLLQHLNVVAGNLENVTHQMQQNPAVIVRGRTPAQPGPGENR